MNKLLIGKPIGANDATNGQMTPTVLAGCLKGLTGVAGIMGFEVRQVSTPIIA